MVCIEFIFVIWWMAVSMTVIPYLLFIHLQKIAVVLHVLWYGFVVVGIGVCRQVGFRIITFALVNHANLLIF